MVFKFIDTVLDGIEIDLIVLKRNTQSYRKLLYQHDGRLLTQVDSIGNQLDVEKKINQILLKAKAEKLDLLLTPEYCFPWKVLKNLVITKEIQPPEHALWIFGLESVTPIELTAFEKFAIESEVIFYFDKSVLQKPKTFLDPVCYAFIEKKTKRLVLVFQFKTKHMGVWSEGTEIERDNMIEGNEIIILRNSGTEPKINFITLICSEAMVFALNLTAQVQQSIDWVDKPFIIFNPQCNADPAHSRFVEFRKFVLEYEKKEIITLNWNVTSFVNGRLLPRYSTVRSSIFLKSNEVETIKGNVIKNNHKLGLYYYSKGLNKHLFVLNGTPVAYLIKCTPVVIEGLAVLSKRDGPKIEEAFRFDNNSLVRLHDVLDNHVTIISNQYQSANRFLNSHDKCIIEKERLACLSSGKITGKNAIGWHEVLKLHSFIMGDQEENNRITATEDSYQSSLDARARYLEAINELDNIILKTPNLLPESLADLKAKQIEIGYDKDASTHRYRYNIVTTKDAPIQATVCYLGVCTEKERQLTYDSLRLLFDEFRSTSKGRVVVFYKEATKYKSLHDPSASKITETYNNEGPSILR
jgi:hypothetical protein